MQQFSATCLSGFISCSTSDHSRLCLNDFSGLFSSYFSLYMILFFDILVFNPAAAVLHRVPLPFFRIKHR